MNTKFISTTRKKKKTIAENSTYKHILKKMKAQKRK